MQTEGGVLTNDGNNSCSNMKTVNHISQCVSHDRVEDIRSSADCCCPTYICFKGKGRVSFQIGARIHPKMSVNVYNSVGYMYNACLDLQLRSCSVFEVSTLSVTIKQSMFCSPRAFKYYNETELVLFYRGL